MSLTIDKPTLHKFIVWAPDMTDADAFKRRLSVREKHLAGVIPKHDSGLIRIGGVLLTPESIASPNAEKKMIGSMLICEAESIDVVRNMIESDIYYSEGVWDKEKLQIYPFMTAHLN